MLQAALLKITIPPVRQIDEYHLNKAAVAGRRESAHDDLHAAPYVRHQELLPGMYEDQQHAEYDMDEQDEEILNKLNAQVGRGLYSMCCLAQVPKAGGGFNRHAAEGSWGSGQGCKGRAA